ncbi:MAG TPA: mechanosensitive ion channel protein MscS, partial [bacterium]
LFMEFGDSSWNLRLRVWINDPKRHQQVRSDINCGIVRKFRTNNIEIPFPQRDVHIRSPLPGPLTSNP